MKKLLLCLLSVFISIPIFALAESPIGLASATPVVAVATSTSPVSSTKDTHARLVELEQKNQALAEQVNRLQDQVDFIRKDQETLADAMNGLKLVLRSMATDYLTIATQLQQMTLGYRFKQMMRESPLTTTGSLVMVILLLGVLIYLLYRDRQKRHASHHFSGEDAVRGQLDLARTYVGMGDHAKAKELLKQAAKQGDASQRAEAMQLLQTITI